jgi:hypothetical protein
MDPQISLMLGYSYMDPPKSFCTDNGSFCYRVANGCPSRWYLADASVVLNSITVERARRFVAGVSCCTSHLAALLRVTCFGRVQPASLNCFETPPAVDT